MPPIKFQPTEEQTWLMSETGFEQRRVQHYETILTLANGYSGLRASPEMTPLLGAPGFYVAGVFDQVHGFEQEIVNLPCWLNIDANLDGFDFDLRKGQVLEYRRVLDMKQGLLFSYITWRDDAKHTIRWESIRLLHMTEKHLGLIWGSITALDCSVNLQLGTSLDAWAIKHSSASGKTHLVDIRTFDLDGMGIGLSATTKQTGITVTEATQIKIQGTDQRSISIDDDRISESVQMRLEQGKPVYFEKRACTYTSRDGADPAAMASAELQRLSSSTAHALAKKHVQAWQRIWDVTDICIEGDEHAQRAVRFNAFHLASLADPKDTHVSIGAKGLHGNGYKGLIFWDTEIYLVPMFIYTNPAAARALLTYRHHLLPDAAENARALGFTGVRYPWNSAITGREDSWIGWQEHVNPDIAYAVEQYVLATGDEDFYLNFGAELIIATAAYWPSRVEYDGTKQQYVLLGLTGSDEIHTNIDNNTFTNYLVKWHLRQALQAVTDLKKAGRWEKIRQQWHIKEEDLLIWQAISDRIYLPSTREQGFHEQFEGFFKLKEREIDRGMTQMEYTGPVMHAFRPTRVAKQADTVLMYSLFPHDFPEEVRRAGYQFYEPHCAHTSTLSRSIFATVAAQTGLVDEAYRLFIRSAETDFGDEAECDSGIHAACLGGNWQAVIMGFGGLTVNEAHLSFTPHLPAGWTELAFKVCWQKKIVEVTITQQHISLHTLAGEVSVLVNGQLQQINDNIATFALIRE